MDRYTFEFMMKVDDDTFINNKLLFDFLYKYMKPKYNDKNRGYYGGLLFTFYSAHILGTRFLPKGRPPKSRIFKPHPSPYPGMSEFTKPPPPPPSPDVRVRIFQFYTFFNFYTFLFLLIKTKFMAQFLLL